MQKAGSTTHGSPAGRPRNGSGNGKPRSMPGNWGRERRLGYTGETLKIFRKRRSGTDGMMTWYMSKTAEENIAARAGITVEQVKTVMDLLRPPSHPGIGWLIGRKFRPLKDIPRAKRDMLRPMAETLAMLDGNAFFGNEAGPGVEWWEQYVPEAEALFKANGGMKGWAGMTSFAKRKP